MSDGERVTTSFPLPIRLEEAPTSQDLIATEQLIVRRQYGAAGSAMSMNILRELIMKLCNKNTAYLVEFEGGEQRIAVDLLAHVRPRS